MFGLDTKICTKCGIEKTFALFMPDKRRKHGLGSWCRACMNSISQEWQKNNKQRVKENIRRWGKENSERRNRVNQLWRKNNPERWRESYLRAGRKKRSTPFGRLGKNIREEIRNSLRGNKSGRHWEYLVGYSLCELKSRLKKQFIEGMSWDNYGEVWEIDHIIPVRVFNFENPKDIDFRRCFSLFNLRPLWKIDNRKKSGKIEKPFQPSLLIGDISCLM